MNRPFHALRRALGIAAVCALALPAAWAGQAKYPTMVVFGDSLSDTGNVFIATSAPPSPFAIPPSVSPRATYWQGRFTNGPVAVEYLWRLVARKNDAQVTPSLAVPAQQAKSAVSFAFGGSTSGGLTPSPLGGLVPGLQAQVAQFTGALGPKKASSQALYVVWSGSNDYLQQTPQAPADPHTVVANVASAIRTLYAQGARDFLVPNLADLGITPFATFNGVGATLTLQSQSHNALLKATLTGLERELRQSRIVELDVLKLGAALLSTGLISADIPALEYLAPGTGALDCLFRDPASCVDVAQPAFMPPFLFWDVMHPTTQVHGVLGTAMFGALLTQR